MTLKIISQYRQELMGLAMLMVVFHHTITSFSNPIYLYLHCNGCFGVDIFLLLSGMGLYYSARNGLNLRQYYRRRLLRILPLYFVIVGVVSIWQGNSLSTYLLKASTIGYWTTGEHYDWFIPNLIFLYLVFPLFHKLIFNRRLGFVLGLAVAVGLYLWASFQPSDSNFMQVLRWPTFFLGSLLGCILFPAEGKRGAVDSLTVSAFRGGAN